MSCSVSIRRGDLYPDAKLSQEDEGRSQEGIIGMQSQAHTGHIGF